MSHQWPWGILRMGSLVWGSPLLSRAQAEGVHYHYKGWRRASAVGSDMGHTALSLLGSSVSWSEVFPAEHFSQADEVLSLD